MLRFSTAGESHGESLVAMVSGLPAGVPVDQEFIDRELWRRQKGYGRGGRMRIEQDRAHILSGVGRRLVRPWRWCWRITTGRTGRRFCRLKRAMRPSIRLWLRRGLDMPIL